jgi:hypothetical protein
MSSQTNGSDTPEQQKNSSVSTTAKETKIVRLANKAATRGVKRQQRYDREHNIFTK